MKQRTPLLILLCCVFAAMLTAFTACETPIAPTDTSSGNTTNSGSSLPEPTPEVITTVTQDEWEKNFNFIERVFSYDNAPEPTGEPIDFDSLNFTFVLSADEISGYAFGTVAFVVGDEGFYQVGEEDGSNVFTVYTNYEKFSEENEFEGSVKEKIFEDALVETAIAGVFEIYLPLKGNYDDFIYNEELKCYECLISEDQGFYFYGDISIYFENGIITKIHHEEAYFADCAKNVNYIFTDFGTSVAKDKEYNGVLYGYNSFTDVWSVIGLADTEVEEVVIASQIEEKPVKTIGDWAFCGCSGLTSITIPDSVTSIGFNALSGCSGLTSVTFGENSQLATIGRYAFLDCSSLTSIEIPDSVTNIDEAAFGYSGLTSVKFEENSQLTTIGEFYGCISLTSIEIPDGVTTIANYAFSGCSGLASISIPNSVTSIGNYAFSGCSGLTRIDFIGTKAQWDAISKDYNYWNYNIPSSCRIYCTDGTLDINGNQID